MYGERGGEGGGRESERESILNSLFMWIGSRARKSEDPGNSNEYKFIYVNALYKNLNY